MQHYNSNYRNDTYTAVKQALQPLVDEQTRIRLMNHVTDAALDICGYSPCAGAVVTLADELIAELRDTDLPSVISPIEAHLKHFLHPQRNHSQQRLIAHFLLRLRLQSLDRELHLTVINAADLPGWQNVTAYYLLSAAWSLIAAATKHLQGNHTPDYIAESLQRVLGSLDLAVQEWTSHVDNPPRIVTVLKSLLADLTRSLD
jgi:hypothetical protein